MIEYEDFSIKIEPQREGTYPVIVLRSPAGEGRSSFRLPFDPDELGDLLAGLGAVVRGPRAVRDARPLAAPIDPKQVGDRLFSALFAGPARSLLYQSLGMIRERRKGLRIKLHIDPQEPSLTPLASLPWELLYRRETDDFLNLSRFTPTLRYLEVQAPYAPLALELPLRVLVIISSPSDHTRLDLERERAQIERTWASEQNVEVHFLETPTIGELQEQLEREPFHVLHYMGHGGFDPRSGSGVLLLEDEAGRGAPVDGRTLGVLLRDVPTLRLVFLNACETARIGREAGLDPFAGVAAAIVMAGAPAVVAMQFPISDAAAIRFAGRFYALIALGEPVDYAVAEGRRAIRMAGGETMEWATPILFMRAPDGVLFDVKGAPKPQAEPWPVPPRGAVVDPELEERLDELYIAGLAAYWLEEWDRACQNFQEIVDQRPDYKDALAKLQEAGRRWHQQDLYRQARKAQEAGSWTAAMVRLEELVAEEPTREDAAALLEEARRQKHLGDLYKEARQLHGAGQWAAVLRVFDQIQALEPDYPDPDGLLATARQEVEALEREAELKELYSQALLEMEGGRWEEARQCLLRLREKEAGYRDAERLLARAVAELEQAEAERRRREKIETLYEEAFSLARAGQWRLALTKMDEIRALDAGFPDPQKIEARARARLAQEEAEAQQQHELAALYAEAVRQVAAGEYQKALETWDRVQALDPRYPDRKKVQAAARKALGRPRRRARPLAGVRLPRRALVVTGAVAAVAIVAAAVLALSGILRGEGRIAFTSGRDGNLEIYVMAPDGSGQTNLTNNPGDDCCPAWSPDGKRIAFAADRGGTWEIYVMNADGSGQTRLTMSPRDETLPAWSPDGQRIAFVYNDGDTDAIMVMDADGDNRTRLTFNPVNDRDPCWSPDGAHIAFASGQTSEQNIVVMKADGSEQERRTFRDSNWLPAWSPDGTKIAVVTDRDGNMEVYVMDADGGNQTNLTDHPADEWSASWSPDGRRLVFSSDRDGDDQEIYVMEADGSRPVRLTTNTADDWFPAWSP